jgi:glycosyltransferase involved in cell wall biosynthesis
MVISRLLRELPPGTCALISKPAPGETETGAEPPRHLLPAEPLEGLARRGGCAATLSLLPRILVRGWRVARLLRDRRCNALVAATGDLVDVPAAAVASALSGTPLALYLFDDYLNQWGFAPRLGRWAAELERFAVQQARHIIVPNEFMARELKRRHQRGSVLIRNPALQVAPGIGNRRNTGTGKAPVVLYTGAIYHVNATAFRTLLRGMRSLETLAPRLHIYTAQPVAMLRSLGIDGPDVKTHGHVDPETAFGLQGRADVLFMGFAFDSQIPTVVRTSAPGKLGDYLASGRPILALAPPDSYLAEFLRGHRCGLVVDRDEPELVARALKRLLTDEDLAEGLVENALRVAQAEFAPRESARRFLAMLEELRAAPPT